MRRYITAAALSNILLLQELERALDAGLVEAEAAEKEVIETFKKPFTEADQQVNDM